MIFGRRITTIGLDVGSRFVKAAVIDHRGDEPKLLRLASLPLEEGAIVEGEIIDQTGVVETIKAVIKKLELETRTVVTSVGGREVVVKRIQMDRMPDNELHEVIRWEAEHHLPFDKDSAKLDYQLLDPASDEPQMNVLLVAAKRQLVDQRIDLLMKAGLEVSIVDIDALAIFNSLKFNYPSASRGFAVLVDVENEVARMIVHESGVPHLARNLLVGHGRVREEQQDYSASVKEAKSRIHWDISRSEVVGRSRGETAMDLIAEIGRVTAFPGIDGEIGALSAVRLCGEVGRSPGLQEAIAERLRVRTEVVNPLERLGFDERVLADLPDEETAVTWMLPVGLALRGSTITSRRWRRT